VSIGSAVSELVRRGLSLRRSTRLENGLHAVDLPADSQEVRLADTVKALGISLLGHQQVTDGNF
jgi:hypothetical protein